MSLWGKAVALPQSRNDGLITAIDIGSSKISALIARVDDAGELEVLGSGQRESRGVRRGYIADMRSPSTGSIPKYRSTTTAGVAFSR